jgi:uncharacterized membrane protein YkoI
MNQRTLLATAAALTAFALLVIGVVGGRLALPAGQASATPAASAEPTPGQAADMAYQQRMAAYEAALAEANHRLELANQQIAERAAAAGTGESIPRSAVTAEQAQAIALGAAPGAALIKPAELVSYQGTPAYEVVLDRGTLYIDAHSAAVLANGAASGTVTAEQAAQAALAYRGGGTVRDARLEQEEGAVIFEVKFTDGAEVYVDPATGQVVYAQLSDHAGDEHDDQGEHDD